MAIEIGWFLNPHEKWTKMGIVLSYVSLPEGIWLEYWDIMYIVLEYDYGWYCQMIKSHWDPSTIGKGHPMSIVKKCCTGGITWDTPIFFKIPTDIPSCPNHIPIFENNGTTWDFTDDLGAPKKKAHLIFWHWTKSHSKKRDLPHCNKHKKPVRSPISWQEHHRHYWWIVSLPECTKGQWIAS